MKDWKCTQEDVSRVILVGKREQCWFYPMVSAFQLRNSEKIISLTFPSSPQILIFANIFSLLSHVHFQYTVLKLLKKHYVYIIYFYFFSTALVRDKDNNIIPFTKSFSVSSNQSSSAP